MVAEVLEHLAPSRGGVFVDCTVGLGGHARALLDAGASRVIGLDRDPTRSHTRARRCATFGERVELVHADYRGFERGARREGYRTRRRRAGGSRRVVDAARRAGPRLQLPAGRAARHADGYDRAVQPRPRCWQPSTRRTLADVIYEFGEERHARRVARAIVAARNDAPIETTGQLADIVRRRFRARGTRGSIRRRGRFRRFASGSIAELEGLDGFLDASRRAARRRAGEWW